MTAKSQQEDECAHEDLLIQVSESSPMPAAKRMLQNIVRWGSVCWSLTAGMEGSPQVHPPWHLLQVIGRALAVSQ